MKLKLFPKRSNGFYLLVLLLNFLMFSLKTQSQTLSVHALIQGYYIGDGMMTPALFNQDVSGSDQDVDYVVVEAHLDDAAFTLVSTYTAMLNIHGNASGTLNGLIAGTGYYFTIHSRNALLTCSKRIVWPIAVVNFNQENDVYQGASPNPTLFDFEDGNFGLYSGDVNGDHYIDTGDVGPTDIDNIIARVFYHAPGVDMLSVTDDVNGDAYVDTADVTVVDNNNLSAIEAECPICP